MNVKDQAEGWRYPKMPEQKPFVQYREALDGAGPKLKEIILDRAARDDRIGVLELKALVNFAYPEPWA